MVRRLADTEKGYKATTYMEVSCGWQSLTAVTDDTSTVELDAAVEVAAAATTT